MTNEAPQVSAPAQPAPPKKNHLPLYIGIGVAAVLVIGAGVGIPMAVAENERAAAEKAAQAEAAAEAKAERERLAMFSNAIGACGIDRSEEVQILDLGESIVFDGVSRSFISPVQLDDIDCFLGEIGAPSSLESRIGSTRALDGTQSEDWDGFSIEWRYHPDTGAMIVVEHED